MLVRFETLLRWVRRNLNRSLWLARLLRLRSSEGPPSRPGLLMIQVDGLSQRQFERALAEGELPFLRQLMIRDNYQPHAFYSGLPATTAAVQAELFYGVKAAVPAFCYRDHESRQTVRMYEAEAATKIEALYADHDGGGLLSGGSAYSDNYTGGAEESHFCASSMGWGPALRGANPLVLLVFILTNLYSALRVAGLLLLELGLALVDSVRGFSKGQNLAQELKFIPARVAIAILLRELCVIGGKIDISRGLPIIHINFLGYDEQAHRRGPDSLFAHWSLKGIDDAIARLTRAAGHCAWRHYDVWVYSDHGQVATECYHDAMGYTLDEAITRAFKTARSDALRNARRTIGSIQTTRARLLGGNRVQRLFSIMDSIGPGAEDAGPVVAALGPVGHVYSEIVRGDALVVAARELAQTHKVPVVLKITAAGQLRGWAADREFHLPQDVGELFGANHPFLDSLGEDLVRLCDHPDAGDLVLLGWREGVSPMTFAMENGSHAGTTPEETNGFALLPVDAPLTTGARGYLRPDDLRRAALRLLGRRPRQRPAVSQRPIAARTDTLRVMTYNVHSCIGMDGRVDVARIARVIARARPDVVALQEIDVGRPRSHGMDQAHLIAHHLEMEFHFHPALHLEDERYGDAILTHLPQRLVKAGSLPGLASKPRLEPRGALWVAIDLHGTEIQVINTHLGLNARERIAQTEALLGREWLADERCRGPVILCGDFNALPGSPVCRRLGQQLADAQVEATGHRPRATFYSRFPTLRIDHIFIGPGIEAVGIEIPHTGLARLASDHLPLVAELRFTVPDD